ncbi:MAG TPA: carboxymuconolactone decarboxylase family protein [Mycobacteriales bacterium]|nr:carboxymuconolactone decarboxylase family protein [Mycobacteriales bacterium]
MSRLEKLRPEELDTAQRELYDALTGGPRGASLADEQGRLVGPFNAMLLAPRLGNALQRLGGLIRYRGALSDRARELAILTVAARQRCGFEQRAHERIGAGVGLTDTELAALRTGAPLELADPEEAAVLAATRALVAGGDLDDAGYAAATAALGEQKLFELTTLVGYYALLATQMRVFGVT